ncbi:MAG: trimethylamine methyltransferase family protein [Paracoccaceae bacterium]
MVRENKGRSNRRRRRTGIEHVNPQIAQLPWKQPEYSTPPVELLNPEQIDLIHAASLDILKNIGMKIQSADARARLRKAGVDVNEETELARFDPALVEELIKTAPSSFTLHARNPEKNLEIGGKFITNSCVSSPPNASDMDHGRRPGNTKDFQNLLRLSQYFNIIHLIGGYPVEPIDRHVSTRHLLCAYDMLTLTDKAISAYAIGNMRIRDCLEMVRIARGVDAAELDREPSLFTIVNTNSPLIFDGAMLDGLIEMSLQNQIVCVTPFTLAGAMAPVTLAGALAQQNAEALAGLLITQIVRPGAPFIYGGFTSIVDMKSGAPAFGTPEYMQTAMIGGQLARRYNVPYRTSGVNAANTVDAQAAYESVFSLWGTTMGHGNIIMHAAGWMEGGLVASFEKLVLDVDLLQMVAKYLEPVVVDKATLGLDSIIEAGHGGHFFGTAHTQERYRDAFYTPLISDWRNYELWAEDGAPQSWERANKVWKSALKTYEEPPMEPAIREALNAFVAKRTEEGGVATDF